MLTLEHFCSPTEPDCQNDEKLGTQMESLPKEGSSEANQHSGSIEEVHPPHQEPGP
jgi:hypothetical protein